MFALQGLPGISITRLGVISGVITQRWSIPSARKYFPLFSYHCNTHLSFSSSSRRTLHVPAGTAGGCATAQPVPRVHRNTHERLCPMSWVSTKGADMRSGFAFAVPADRHSIPCELGTCELPDDMTGGKSGLMLPYLPLQYHYGIPPSSTVPTVW